MKNGKKKPKKRKRQIKFEDLLALYKFIKDNWGSISLINERLDRIEEEIEKIKSWIEVNHPKRWEKRVKALEDSLKCLK